MLVVVPRARLRPGAGNRQLDRESTEHQASRSRTPPWPARSGHSVGQAALSILGHDEGRGGCTFMLRDRYDHMWDEGTVRPCAVTLQPTYLPEHMSSLNCNGSRASCNLGGDGEMAGHEGALALHHCSLWSQRL